MSDQSLASIGIQITSTAGTAAQDLDKLVASGDAADKVVADLGSTSKATAAQMSTVGTAAKQLAQAQGATNETIKAAGISAAQYAQSLRLLPIQIHQGFDQLLYGTNPLIVLATQVPQITESFGGVGNALKAVTGFITPATVGFTALAAAAAAAGAAALEISEESDHFAKSLITTGNAAGLTVSQLEKMRQTIEDIGGVTRGDAVSALNATLSAGITTNVQQIAQLAAQLQELGGNSIAQTIKEFASLGQDPVRAAEALQKSIAFLTPEVYNDIAALEKQGGTAAATALAQQQLTKSLSEQVTQLKAVQGGFGELGSVIKSLASKAYFGLGNFLIPSNQTIIDGLNTRIQALKQYGTKYADTIASLNKEVAGLQVGPAAGAAQQAGENASQSAQAMKANLAAQTAANIAAASQYQDLITSAQTSAIERQLQAELAATQRYDQLLDAEHSAHLVTDQAYYAAKRADLDKDTQAQVDAAEKQITVLKAQEASIRQAAADFANSRSGPDDQADVIKNQADVEAKLVPIQEQIFGQQAKINEAYADGANKVKVLGITQTSVAKTALDTLNNLRASEQAYLDTLQRGYQLQLQGLTAGPTGKQRLQDLSQVDAQALQQRQQLDQAKRINPELPNYDAQLKAIEDTHQKAIADTNSYYDALDKAQANWLTGAQSALNTYEESAKDISAQVGTVFTDVFQGMEDTFVNFAQTGKLSFKSLADSIIGDIARIIAKQEVGGLANLFSSILPFSAGIDYGAASDWAITNGFTLGSLPGFASGGAISGPAIVGENGPELFVPDTSGFVVPNNKLSSFGASGPAVTVNQTIHVGAGVDRATMAAALEINRKQTVATVSNLIKGGAYRK